MPLYLCLDGGGTKTTAVIASVPSSALALFGAVVCGRGEAGPSNLTASGSEACLSAIARATQSALESLPLSHHPTPSSSSSASSSSSFPGFARIWAGIAGCSRPPELATLSPLLHTLFPGAGVRLTNDAELLTSPVYLTHHTQVITVICGTGSLGILWRRSPQQRVTQIARSGGWGYLLGDEGSGWSLGRDGIKSVLTTHIDRDPLRPWHKEILARFGVEDVNALLPVCMSLDGGLTHVDAEGVRKGRISGCARIVVNAAVGGDELARSVMGKVAREVVDLVEPLVSRPPTRSDPGDGTVRASGDTRNGGGIGGGVDGRGESGLVLGETMLVMGGGLSGVPIFRGMVEAGMKERGWRWGEVRVVDDPAGDGVRALMNG